MTIKKMRFPEVDPSASGILTKKVLGFVIKCQMSLAICVNYVYNTIKFIHKLSLCTILRR